MGLQTVTIFREPMHTKVIPLLACLVGKMLSFFSGYICMDICIGNKPKDIKSRYQIFTYI